MQKIMIGVLGLICVALYVVGIIGLATIPGANEIPTPGGAVVAGVLAMFATLGFFVFGFLRAATLRD